MKNVALGNTVTLSKHTEAARIALRKTLRHARKSLASETQHSASTKIAEQLFLFFSAYFANIDSHRPINVASYLVNDGEVNLSSFMTEASKTYSHLHFALPVLHPVCKGHLLFLNYAANTPLVKNKYNIEEPELACPNIIPSSQLDIILMPLVGFDAAGNRLGMGGGYYDRTLAFTKHANKKPLLIGIAHDIQEVDSLPIAPWDIPLNAIITPTRTLSF